MSLAPSPSIPCSPLSFGHFYHDGHGELVSCWWYRFCTSLWCSQVFYHLLDLAAHINSQSEPRRESFLVYSPLACPSLNFLPPSSVSFPLHFHPQLMVAIHDWPFWWYHTFYLLSSCNLQEQYDSRTNSIQVTISPQGTLNSTGVHCFVQDVKFDESRTRTQIWIRFNSGRASADSIFRREVQTRIWPDFLQM